MKGKTLALLALTAATAFTASAADKDREEAKNREFLAGYANSDVTNGEVTFNGFNLEYRQYFNDYFGVGGALGYGFDTYKSADFEVGNLDVNALVRLPVKSFYLYGKAGLSYTSIKASGTACTFYGCYDVSTSDNDVTPIFGFGVNVPFKDNMNFDLSYIIKEPSYDFGAGAKGETELRTIMAQVGWRF